MRVVIIVVLTSLLAGQAFAQGASRRNDPTPPAKTEDLAKKKADEAAYQRALKIIPEPKGKIDPWSGAR